MVTMVTRDYSVVENLFAKNGKNLLEKMECIEKISQRGYSAAMWGYAKFLVGSKHCNDYRAAFRKAQLGR